MAAEPKTRRGYIGLGSNLDDRDGHLRAGVAMLWRAGAQMTATSGVYVTAPVGEYPGEQPDFHNIVIEVETGLAPHDLLDACKAIEVERGRDLAGPRHGPRPLDVDILLLGDLELESERLAIPHPRLTERRFVLEPLAELAPGLPLPGGRGTVAAALTRVRHQRVERLGPLT